MRANLTKQRTQRGRIGRRVGCGGGKCINQRLQAHVEIFTVFPDCRKRLGVLAYIWLGGEGALRGFSRCLHRGQGGGQRIGIKRHCALGHAADHAQTAAHCFHRRLALLIGQMSARKHHAGNKRGGDG